MRILVLFLLVSAAAAQEATVSILHWNDFHSQNVPFQVRSRNRATNSDTAYFVGGAATLASYLAKYDRGDSATLTLHAGDEFQGTPVSSITKGASQVRLLNMLRPDAFSLGNHDFDYGRTNLASQLKTALYPALSANLIDQKSGTPFAGDYIIRRVGGANVAVIGLMTTELYSLSLPKNIEGLTVKDLAATVKGLVPVLKAKGADLIVALTHQGVQEDSLLAVLCPDLDVIVGGHSHTPLFRPKYVNGILIAQAGSRGRWLGKIELTVDTAKDTVLRAASELIECRTADVTPDAAVAAVVDELEKEADSGLNVRVAELKSDWKRTGGESNIGNWICDAMRAYAKSDIAIQNTGGIRKDVLAGPLTVRDFWEISPFGNTLVTFSVTGAELRSMLQHQVSVSDDFCQLSGLTVVYANRNGVRTLHNVTVGRQTLDDRRTYTIVTNNYVAAQAKKYFGLELPESRLTALNVTDRDVLIEAARQQKVIDTKLENRIKETEE